MRVTTRMLYRNMQYDINKLSSNIQRVNKQISSGMQMSSISDNPTNLMSALRMRSDLSDISQYQENLTYGKSMVTAAETALTEMKDLLMQANTLALQANNATMTQTNRDSLAEEVNSLYEQAVSLANTQLGGKYIFGGYRTTGYTENEPAPFIAGLADSYQVNGSSLAPLDTMLTGSPLSNATDLAAGDLVLNGEDMGSVDLTTASLMVNGVNMGGAANLKAAINANSSTVTASLTTLYACGCAATGGTDTLVAFSLNGTAISFTTSSEPATDTIAAINAVSDQTGVTAYLGDGSNGGTAGAIVLENTMAGDESNITITSYSETGGTANTGLADVDQAVGPTSNTGKISLSSSSSFSITSNRYNDDTTLNLIGLGGGGIGFYDKADDGTVFYGYRLGTAELSINGTEIDQPAADGISTVFADASAAAKAAAINAISEITGVSADITPALIANGQRVDAGILDSGDLIINGVDIFSTSRSIMASDVDNTLITAINDKSDLTGVTASRNSSGQLLLSAIDGRNIEMTTSAVGESVTHLNDAAPATGQSKVYFGSVILQSDTPFTLQSGETLSGEISGGLASLGLDSGSETTHETKYIAEDGLLTVSSLVATDGNVRYAGDTNNLQIKIGASSTLTIAVNGQTAVSDTGIFDALYALQQALLGSNYTDATGANQATNTKVLLSNDNTGLGNLEDGTKFEEGSFTITVYDNYAAPPGELTVEIPVNPDYDSLDSVAAKIDGISGINAYWETDGTLHIESSNEERYTFSLENDSSLNLAGMEETTMQSQALDQCINNIQSSIEKITSQVSNCGTTYNRIEVQNQIYDELDLAIQENLSIKQDTDLVEAAMQLSAKTTAYEAALAAAAKVTEVNLVDFLY